VARLATVCRVPGRFGSHLRRGRCARDRSRCTAISAR